MEKKGCGENSSPVEESKVVSMSSDSDRSSRTETLSFAASSAVPTAPAASPAVTVTTDTSSTVPAASSTVAVASSTVAVASSTVAVASSTAPAVPVATSGWDVPWEAASKRVIRSQEELDALALPHTHEYHCCTVLVRRCAMSGDWAFSAQQTRPCSHETPCRHHRRQITQTIAYTRRQFRADRTDNARVRLKPLHSLLWLLAVRHILPNTNDEANSTAGDADAPHVVIVVSPAAWRVLNICMRQLTPVMKQLLSNCLAQPALGKWFVQTSSSATSGRGPSSLDETQSEIASPVTSTLLHSPLATLARMSTLVTVAQVATPPRAAAAVPTSSPPYTSTDAFLVPEECVVADDIVYGSSVAVDELHRFTENVAPPWEPSLSWNVACTNDLS